MRSQLSLAADMSLLPPDDARLFAEIKRFEERWDADARFRTTYPDAPRRVGTEAGVRVDPDVVRAIWDRASSAASTTDSDLARYREFRRRFFREHDDLEEVTPWTPDFARWRQRQVYRTNLQVGVSLLQNPHIAASFELSRGCSVGCWFCSASPPKLSDVFAYTAENAQLWRSVLEALVEIAGPAARSAICYSGSDPFDNPEYERFADDFAAIVGKSPFTSTALPLRDVERTRRLMAQSLPYNLRFSVLSLGMLTRIHAAFTPEELLFVFIATRNEGSLGGRLMTFAGRARERAATYRRYREGPPILNTPSCETGFKFNMVDRRIRLSSPCIPDDRWPAGNIVYEEAAFSSGDDARRFMWTMVETHMSRRTADLPRLRFMRYLRFEPSANGFALVGPHLRQRFEATPETPFMTQLGALIASGRYRADAIVEQLTREHDAQGEAVAAAIDDLFRLGTLDEEPPEGISGDSLDEVGGGIAAKRSS